MKIRALYFIRLWGFSDSRSILGLLVFQVKSTVLNFKTRRWAHISVQHCLYFHSSISTVRTVQNSIGLFSTTDKPCLPPAVVEFLCVENCPSFMEFCSSLFPDLNIDLRSTERKICHHSVNLSIASIIIIYSNMCRQH